jgi:hypothetical protein
MLGQIRPAKPHIPHFSPELTVLEGRAAEVHLSQPAVVEKAVIEFRSDDADFPEIRLDKTTVSIR